MRRALAAGALLLLAVAVAACGATGADGVVRLPTGAFVPSDHGRRAVVWAVGDGANGSAPARALARRIAAERPARVLYLGDVYDEGTRSDFARNFAPVYGALVGRMAPTPGNHDWPRHQQGYDPYWARVHGRPTPSFYAFRAGGWQLLSLNSEAPHGAGSKQLRWLRGKLRAPGTCRLAFWHRPRYSAGTHHGDQADVQPLWSALRGHATLVLNGHEHDLQRFRPRDGITELVSGAGGDGHYAVHPGYPGLAWADARHNGALRLVLRPGRAAYAFVDTRGRTLDAGSVRCRRG
jgi:acid phosphatase type 7